MAGHREPPGIIDGPSVRQACQGGQRFRFYRADRHWLTRAKCTVQNARPCSLHDTASANSP
ncbi:hypothetical protein CXB65_00405 [Pseudomonas monteilii]|uniref:Uncharacterized protein n=1 Tax=Pseudomonas monteilii TaxID=76759 RepID=A0A2N1IZ86_9PSED|nr:hypothetical protein B7H19_27870 [Pseudomonas putida]PKI26042.1 hypothetical protein CXB65_00405 [Pseudomonas monteilii]RPD95797.1 hypothetical protein EGN69_07970 [Pseudomonas monteilii]TFW20365.1 hypothetical protein E4L40_21455 [Pseudomonas putida]